MTQTDELRRMLNEAGVEHEWSDRRRQIPSRESVRWQFGDNGMAKYIEYRDGSTLLLISDSFAHLTPAQAIAATVGRGTCEADETETIKCWVKCKDEPNTERMELIHVMECSECGHTYEHVNGDYEFCPRCGRKRADE